MTTPNENAARLNSIIYFLESAFENLDFCFPDEDATPDEVHNAFDEIKNALRLARELKDNV